MTRRIPILLCLIVVVCLAGGYLQAVSRTYTTDADFDEGVLVNVNHDAPNNDQLQLNLITSTFPYVWVANSNRGTVVKVDVNTGAVLGEYLSSPDGRGKNPSRTTVDRNGNMWVSNRNESSGGLGSVLKIGLIDGGTRTDAAGNPDPNGLYHQGPFTFNNCVDRDSDGLIKSSWGLGDIRPWPAGTDGAGSPCTAADPDAKVVDADDECLLVFQRVNGRNTRHVSVDANNDAWVGGYNFADEHDFDHLDEDTGCILNTRSMPCGGYGGFIDCHGVMWSADISSWTGNRLLRHDVAANASMCIGSALSYGLGVDSAGFVWNSQWTNNSIIKVSPAGAVQAGYPKPTFGATGDRGVAVTPGDDHVWVANSLGADVSRLDNNGNLCEVVPVGNGPTGVAVDVNGKVWATNINSSTLSRIDPNGVGVCVAGTAFVDLTVDLNCQTAMPAFCAANPANLCCTTAAHPYNYSDMTGIVALSNPPFGTWNVVNDSECEGTEWGTVSWNSAEPAGTSISVDVRASETEAGLGGESFVGVSNGTPFGPLVGRFLEIRTNFNVAPGETCGEFATPILFDLTKTGVGGSDQCFPNTQGYWHRQCLGLPYPQGIDPGRNGRGPQSPTEPLFVEELMPCADQWLEDLGLWDTLTCRGMDADPPSDKCEKAIKQLTALILNVCSDRVSVCCEVDLSGVGCASTDIAELIDELAMLILNDECHLANDCAGTINEGFGFVFPDGGGGGAPAPASYEPSEPTRRPTRTRERGSRR